MVHGLAITHKGVERIAAQEVAELIKAKTEVGETIVLFEAKELDLCLLCYKAQSVGKILLLLGKTRFKTEEDISSYAESLDFSPYLTKDRTFRVRCVRVGEHGFDSLDIEQGVGEALATKYGCKANLNDPDVPVYIYIHGDDCYIGIDFAGVDLSKRQYRIFAQAEQLKATVAYAMLRVAGFTGKEALLDPFCGGGTILIEAALHACKYPVNYYTKDKLAFRRFLKDDFDAFFAKIDAGITDATARIVGYDSLLKNVKAAQKNAKVAGINKALDISKIDVEWLDIKFGKGEVDLIVTEPPIMTKVNEKAMRKTYKEFFYQAEFVLKKSGKIVLVTPIPDAFGPFAAEYQFRETGRFKVEQGKQALYILTFSHPKA